SDEFASLAICPRLTPILESAATENAEPVQLYWKAEKKSIQQIDDGNPTKTFSFDRVFSSEETTHQLYQDIAKPLVVSTVEGYNGTIFAYGQTSSGKTFTMMGSDLVPGVIPLAMEDVFQTIKNFPKKEFLLRVSYMEIYNETVTDLLVDSWKRKPLEVRETINKNVYVADLTEELVTSPAQALAWIRKGEKNRHYGKTKMNQRSSRSHTIFRMILESRERSDPASGENADGAIIVSHLNLVDLAGSERASQTGAEGARFKEGCNINRSLFTLGQVIKKLSDESQRGFTNYRDSKLTRILQNSLGGNAKTVIICTITPAALDETVSTLQFASTAKNMKNDPHVTEVSDDGALLKRYRNEIVDLKRRLQEVSSITHTTATEKKVLSQLLQEKDQLQREQEDRIRNLTKLLVTSSNFVPVPKMPKRRVTWGGKLLRMAQASESDMGLSDLSFAESVTRKRKAERSCLTELAEDDEDFDSRWEIPEEPSYDAEMNQSSVTVHSFGDSPKDFISPNRIHELSDKVSNLEVQLELETNQKDQAVMKAQTLDAKVAELEEQLKTEAQQKQEAQEKIETVEQRLGELDLKLQSEAQEKQDATEWVEMLELKVADLERQLAQQSQVPSETEQVCLVFRTSSVCCRRPGLFEMVTAERDYLKQELGLFMEQTVTLEKENTALSKELEEKKEMDEFRYLEETCRNEHEVIDFHICFSVDLIIATSAQPRTNDKDLVQQVTQLRRSLDDAEGLSRDTKKEWAVLRSQNIALKERDEALTASYEKMEAEVTGLRSELEAEKSRYKKMQMDLQKELNVAFDENTKLTTLLDGKVPKNLIDSVELERTVANLNKELAASRDTEGALQTCAKSPEAILTRHPLPFLLCSPSQVSELTEELCSVQTQRDSLLSAQAQSQEEVEQLRDSLQTSQDEIIRIQGDLGTAELREQDLSQRFAAATEQLERFRSELEHSEAEKSQLLATLQSVRAERDSLLSERAANPQTSGGETEQLLSKVTSLSEERDQLQEILEGLKEEKRQLKADLEERMEMMIENQEELRVAQEKIRVLEDEINRLQTEKAELESRQGNGSGAEIPFQLEELQNQAKLHFYIQQLTAEIESVRAERDTLLSERAANLHTSGDETEQLLSKVTSLSEERDQLQEILEGLREEKRQLKADLEERMETLQVQQLHASLQTVTEQKSQLESDLQQNTEMPFNQSLQIQQLTAEIESVRAERDTLLSERAANLQTSGDETEQLLSKVTSLSEERDQLQEILEGLREEKRQLKADLEERMETLQVQVCVCVCACALNCFISYLTHFRMRTLTEKLESIQAERDGLLSEKAASLHDTEEMKRLLLQMEEELKQEKIQLNTFRLSTKNILKAKLPLMACDYKRSFQELVKKDLAVFEERRLQDVLLCRVQAPSYSVKEEDLQTLWEHRLSELLDKREFYLQVMMRLPQFYCSSVYVLFHILILQGMLDEHIAQSKELEQLEMQADVQLREERSKTSTLLQMLESAPLKTEADLLSDNQQLALQLQQSEKEVKVCLLVSSQQAEIAKWKSRAIKLKEKNCSNFITSPKSCPDSPKTRFFDGTESLTRNCPKQFFDNSNLGTLPGKQIFSVYPPCMIVYVATGAEKREEWWPLSPKQADLCKNQ
uniref:Centromere-associated protein E n=1 Tax=Myripristis murdjan TaxID=586833 RepID=A0A667XU91_9TELE